MANWIDKSDWQSEKERDSWRHYCGVDESRAFETRILTIHVRISKVRPWSRNLWYIRCDKLMMSYDCLDVNTAEAAKKEAEERVMYAVTGIR